MFAFGQFPEPGLRQVFEGNSAATAIGWAVWYKPPGISMVHFYVQGAGGGGMPGVVGNVSTAAGGGGGGSGASARFIVPARSLPNQLYISVGRGSKAGVASTPGISTYVSVTPHVSSPPASNLLMICTAGGAGAAASGATAGVGGAAGAKSAATACPLIGLAVGMGITLAAGDANIAGHAGGNGGTTGDGPSSQTIPANGATAWGGTGGGGLKASNNAGGVGGVHFPQAGFYCMQPPATPAPATGANTAGNDGASGYVIGLGNDNFPFTILPGMGGSSQSTSASPAAAGGGKGGNGMWGSGGGGGAGGYTGSTAALGGDGGDGVVIITCW